MCTFSWALCAVTDWVKNRVYWSILTTKDMIQINKKSSKCISFNITKNKLMYGDNAAAKTIAKTCEITTALKKVILIINIIINLSFWRDYFQNLLWINIWRIFILKTTIFNDTIKSADLEFIIKWNARVKNCSSLKRLFVIENSLMLTFVI